VLAAAEGLLVLHGLPPEYSDYVRMS